MRIGLRLDLLRIPVLVVAGHRPAVGDDRERGAVLGRPVAVGLAGELLAAVEGEEVVEADVGRLGHAAELVDGLRA